MKKSIPAFLAAVLVTVVLGVGMFLIGQNALGTSTAKAEAVAAPVTLSADTTAQYEQIVAQYQARETQYQAEITQASAQINTANQQIASDSQQLQQYKSLISQLQNSGLISIANDGTVTVNQPNRSGFLSLFGDDHGDNH